MPTIEIRETTDFEVLKQKNVTNRPNRLADLIRSLYLQSCGDPYLQQLSREV
jgi:hypothetical protein